MAQTEAPATHRFKTTLVPGRKRPYTSWTFVVIPKRLETEWGPGRKAVKGTIAGYPFRATASKGEGALRVPIPRDLREKAGLRRGAHVDVALALDPNPPEIDVPDELRAVFKDDPEVASLYIGLPPSCRRAWASHVADARHAETRQRRADRARAGIRARAYPA